MSLNFETDNVYFVPPGQRFILYDIYHMRRLELDLDIWRLYYNQSGMKRIGKAVKTAESLWLEEHRDAREVEQARKEVKSFLSHFPTRPFPSRKGRRLEEKFSPQKITLWVRCSDKALESFEGEDYREKGPDSSRGISNPIEGSVYLSSIGDYELSIHAGMEPQGFFLKVPSRGGVTEHALPPDELLPLGEEFFGAFGSSGKGRLINLTPDARVSKENLACTPLYRIDSHYFATLYFHLQTIDVFDVLLRFAERKIEYTRALLAELGFKKALMINGNELYKRGGALLHLYINAAGKESFGSFYLPPFLLITQNEGKTDPASRSKLMEELLPRFSR